MAELFSNNTFSSYICGWKINPHNNIIPDSKIIEMEKINFFKNQIEVGKYKLANQKFSKKMKKVLSINQNEIIINEIQKMQHSEAVKAISGNNADNKGLLDISILKTLKSKDKRTAIQKAVEKQIELLYQRDKEK